MISVSSGLHIPQYNNSSAQYAKRQKNANGESNNDELQDQYEEIIYSGNAIQAKRNMKRFIQQSSRRAQIVDDIREINQIKEKVSTGFFPSITGLLNKIKNFNIKENLISYLKGKGESAVEEKQKSSKQMVDENATQGKTRSQKQNEIVVQNAQQPQQLSQERRNGNNQISPENQANNNNYSSSSYSNSRSNQSYSQQQIALQQPQHGTTNNVIINYNNYNLQNKQHYQQNNNQHQPNPMQYQPQQEQQQYEIRGQQQQYQQNTSKNYQQPPQQYQYQVQQNYSQDNNSNDQNSSFQQNQKFLDNILTKSMQQDSFNSSMSDNTSDGFQFNSNYENTRIGKNYFKGKHSTNNQQLNKLNIAQKIIVYYDSKYIKEKQYKKNYQKNTPQTVTNSKPIQMVEEKPQVKILKPIPIDPYTLRAFKPRQSKPRQMVDLDSRIKEQGKQQVERIQTLERYNNRFNWKLIGNSKKPAANGRTSKDEEYEEGTSMKAQLMKFLKMRQAEYKKKKQKHPESEENSEIDSEFEEEQSSQNVSSSRQSVSHQDMEEDSNVIYNIDSNKGSQYTQNNLNSKNKNKHRKENTKIIKKKNSSSNDEFQTSCSSDDNEDSQKIKGLPKQKGAREASSGLYRAQVRFAEDLKEEFSKVVLAMTDSPEVFDLFVQFLKKVQSGNEFINLTEKQEQELKDQLFKQFQGYFNQTPMDYSSYQKSKETTQGNKRKELSPIEEVNPNNNKSFNIDQIFNNSASKHDEMVQSHSFKPIAHEIDSRKENKQNFQQTTTNPNSLTQGNNTATRFPSNENSATESANSNNLFAKNTANNIFSSYNSNAANNSVVIQQDSITVQNDGKKKAQDAAVNIFSISDKTSNQDSKTGDNKSTPSTVGLNIFQRIESSPAADSVTNRGKVDENNQAKIDAKPNTTESGNPFQKAGTNIFTALQANNQPSKQPEKGDAEEQQLNDVDQLKKENELIKSQLDIRRSESLTSKQQTSDTNIQPDNKGPTVTDNLIESQVLQRSSVKKIVPVKIGDSKKKDELNNASNSKQKQELQQNETQNSNILSINVFAPAGGNNVGVNIFSQKIDSKSKAGAANPSQDAKPDSKSKQNTNIFQQNAANNIFAQNKPVEIANNVFAQNKPAEAVNDSKQPSQNLTEGQKDNTTTTIQTTQKPDSPSGNQQQNTKTDNLFQVNTKNPFEITTKNPFAQTTANPFASSSSNQQANTTAAVQAPKLLTLDSLVSKNQSTFQQPTSPFNPSQITSNPTNPPTTTPSVNQNNNNLFNNENNVMNTNNSIQNGQNNNNQTTRNPFSQINNNNNTQQNSWLNNNSASNTNNQNNNMWNQNNATNNNNQNIISNSNNNNPFNQQNNNQNLFNNNNNLFQNAKNNNNTFMQTTNNPFQTNNNNQNNPFQSQSGNQNNKNNGLNYTFNGADAMMEDSNKNNNNNYNNNNQMFNQNNQQNNNNNFWNNNNNNSNNNGNNNNNYLSNNPWNRPTTQNNMNYDNMDSMGIENPMNSSVNQNSNQFKNTFNGNNNNNSGMNGNQNFFSQNNNYNPINTNNQQFNQPQFTNFFSQSTGASNLFVKPTTPSNPKSSMTTNQPINNNNINSNSSSNSSNSNNNQFLQNNSQTAQITQPSPVLFDNTQNKTKANKRPDNSTRVTKLIGGTSGPNRIH